VLERLHFVPGGCVGEGTKTATSIIFIIVQRVHYEQTKNKLHRNIALCVYTDTMRGIARKGNAAHQSGHPTITHYVYLFTYLLTERQKCRWKMQLDARAHRGRSWSTELCGWHQTLRCRVGGATWQRLQQVLVVDERLHRSPQLRLVTGVLASRSRIRCAVQPSCRRTASSMSK